MSALTVELIQDEARFDALREEWNELLAASASDCIFLTWEWLRTWWRYLPGNRRLHIVTVRDGEQLIAIAPLAMRPPALARLAPWPALEFLGTGIIGSDYLDFIVRSGREPEARQALADCLSDQTRMLNLSQLHRKFSQAAEVSAQLGRRGWSVSESVTNVCPFIALAGHTWPSFMATLGPKHLTNFERQIRVLGRDFQVRVDRVQSSENRAEELAHLIMLHNLRWAGRQGMSEAFYSPALIAFHEEWTALSLERGWLRLFILRLDGRPSAGLYGLRYGRTFYFFQSGFDPRFGNKHSLGQLILGLTIRSAIEEGAQEYDMLHGAEPYKFRWARETRELSRLELYPAGVRGKLYRGMIGMSRIAKRVGRRMLPGAVADRIAIGGSI